MTTSGATNFAEKSKSTCVPHGPGSRTRSSSNSRELALNPGIRYSYDYEHGCCEFQFCCYRYDDDYDSSPIAFFTIPQLLFLAIAVPGIWGVMARCPSTLNPKPINDHQLRKPQMLDASSSFSFSSTSWNFGDISSVRNFKKLKLGSSF